MEELDRIKERYKRRTAAGLAGLYDPLNPANYMARQERERAFIRWVKASGLAPLQDKSVLEIGCGGGGSLLELLRLGFPPEKAVGNELLPERVEAARKNLPAAVRIVEGDASALSLPPQSFDVVFQSTVFSSILDDEFQEAVAARMWSLAREGGGILSYDFAYSNPKNPDVRGLALQRIRQLFPQGRLRHWRVTLAPPISRRVAKIHPSLYSIFNSLPILRTHLLCWIER